MQEPSKCLTSDCAQAVEWILSFLNTSTGVKLFQDIPYANKALNINFCFCKGADPCHDMAEIACDGWIKNNTQNLSHSTDIISLETLARERLKSRYFRLVWLLVV